MRLSERLLQTMRHYPWRISAGAAALIVLLASSLARGPQPADAAVVEASGTTGPPWRYGRADARFTVIEYADLECPYCRAYFPLLMRWIDANPDVNWEWHHFPLAMHEPAATQGARLAECAGETGGNTAFWKAIAWVYQQTEGNGRGLPPGARFPGDKPALRACLASRRPDGVIRAQANEAKQVGVIATPTLRVVDHRRGMSLLLPAGPIEGDALSSAIDLLASSNRAAPRADAAHEASEKSTDTVSDTPR